MPAKRSREKSKPALPPPEVNVTTVLLVEQETIFREFLAGYINGLSGFKTVGIAGDAQEAEKCCQDSAPGIVILDLMLPSAANSNLAETLKRVSPASKILIFSGTTAPDWVHLALSAGVDGFIEKSSDLETLRRALLTIAEGKQYFSHRITEVMMRLVRVNSSNPFPAGLQHRELQVLREIACGRSSKETAGSFGLTVYAVENIRRRIGQKTGLRSVAELTLHAVKLGLIPPP
jgi:DNA-binding NarL/FixJ family response regulator